MTPKAWKAALAGLATALSMMGIAGLVGATTPDYDYEFKEIVSEVGGLEADNLLVTCQCPAGATNCCAANCILSCCTVTCSAACSLSCRCNLFAAECKCVNCCKADHSSPHSHTYGLGGSVGAKSDTATGGEEAGAGVVTVMDSNANDCNGDGVPGDFDGDYETGVGGGFFGYGPWANEPTCNYGLAVHSGSVVVNDLVFGSAVAFVTGADDTSGPVISTDPVTGETTCTTDGSITPGDPGTDPTADADDCLSDVYTGSGSTCGAGGDGGYWVFLNGALVTEGSGGVGASNPPTAGTITA